jgi:acetate---CoA ligase (ADP-forming)
MTLNTPIPTKDLEHILYPQSIAVVGTNKVKGTVPADILLNILRAEYQGIVYPVNPKEKFIASLKTYKYVLDIEDPVDLAVIVYPSSVCHLALEQCGKKGVKSAVIISAGFKETGPAGAERERQILEIARKYNMSLIGPNCLGVINTDPSVSLNASFARAMPEEGNIAFLSQSGALCTAVLDYARGKHIGFSKFVSFGNKADIDEADLLLYLQNDPKTKVILLYLEEISDGERLMRVAENVIRKSGKPVLAIKSGRTSEGASAAASHTGSLAGSDEICNAAFRQAGILRCDDIEEMFNKAIALAYQPLPEGRRIATITNAGGPGVLVTDSAIHNGLSLASFESETTDILKKNLPKTANINNPVDVIGDARADRYSIALEAILNDANVDGVFVILTPQSMTQIEEIAHAICDHTQGKTKPVYTSFMGETDVAAGIDILQRHKIPHYILPESMCSAFASAHRFKTLLESDHAEPARLTDVSSERAHNVLRDAVNAGRHFLFEHEALNILDAYGFPLVQSSVARSADEAVEISKGIGYPVVLKILSEDIIHKYDAGGVLLDLKSPEEVRRSYDTIVSNVRNYKPEARIQGVLVRKMIPEGVEIILGIKRDPAFGAVIAFGLGGLFVEVFRDVNFRIAPLDNNALHSIVFDTKAAAILTGARGRQLYDIPAIQSCIRRLSQLALDCPQIKELDVNPLIVLGEGDGCFVADVRIMV